MKKNKKKARQAHHEPAASSGGSLDIGSGIVSASAVARGPCPGQDLGRTLAPAQGSGSGSGSWSESSSGSNTGSAWARGRMLAPTPARPQVPKAEGRRGRGSLYIS